jgi:hypothetical protein
MRRYCVFVLANGGSKGGSKGDAASELLFPPNLIYSGMDMFHIKQ